MALPRRRGAVRLRAEGLGALRVRGCRRSADEGRQLLLPAAAHPPPRAQALARSGDDRSRLACHVQDARGVTRSQKVTGPSFTRLTFMSAPKRPVATWTASAAFSLNLMNSSSPSAGAPGPREPGRRPPLLSPGRPDRRARGRPAPPPPLSK